ncbi:MAG: LysR family transcriptional regulator [Limnobacter sp.]|nr:LysR family transcriptional regulator [Limnobacter sp.]
MDRLKLMETYVQVVESGNFSEVARREQTTQSAISKQIQALESQLGVKLLVRTTRSHSLTEAGKLYFERCRQILENVEEARLEVHHTEHDVSGLLRVAAPMAFGRLHLVPRLESFYRQYPHMRIDLQLNDSFVDLVAAGIDVTFRVGELKDSRLIARHIGTVPRALVASKAYIEKHGRPKTVQDLGQHNCLLYTGISNYQEWVFVHPKRGPEAVTVASNFQSNSSEAIRQGVLDGLGLTYSPTWIYGEDLRAGHVEVLLPEWKTSELPLNVVFQPSRRPSLKIRCFVDFFLEEFQNDRDLGQFIKNDTNKPSSR